MTIKEIVEKLGLTILANGKDQDVKTGYTSDLLSEVIANAEEGCLWITVQRHLNVVAVAQLKKVAGIILSGGIDPEPEALAKAEKEGIYIFKSPENSYVLSGKLYALIDLAKNKQ